MGVDSGRTGGFPPTRHSVIERIRDGNDDTRRQAFGDLIEGYWKPVYKHLRITWRLTPDDAQDLTQGFFAVAFQKSWLEKFEPGKARFRTFVRVCADRFVMNARQAASRLKRGGATQTVALDFDGAEREIAARPPSAPPEAEELFHQEFVRALFDNAVRAVRAECERSGRTLHFELFEKYDLSPADDVSYARLAEQFNLTTTQVTNYLAAVRRSFREHALDSLRGLCGSDAEFKREARELFGMELD
jgi:DNA-directed RNA polymerase specialized sigma24 family protein